MIIFSPKLKLHTLVNWSLQSKEHEKFHRNGIWDNPTGLVILLVMAVFTWMWKIIKLKVKRMLTLNMNKRNWQLPWYELNHVLGQMRISLATCLPVGCLLPLWFPKYFYAVCDHFLMVQFWSDHVLISSKFSFFFSFLQNHKAFQVFWMKSLFLMVNKVLLCSNCHFWCHQLCTSFSGVPYLWFFSFLRQLWLLVSYIQDCLVVQKS